MSSHHLPPLTFIDPQQLVAKHPAASWSKDHFGVVHLQHPAMQASISAWGGQLLRWQPSSLPSSPIWLSEKAILPSAQDGKAVKAIRGGVPVCWPWFANELPEKISSPAHGLVRTAWWQISELTTADDTLRCTWQISDTEHTRSIWPYRFRLELTMILGSECDLKLAITNCDNQPWSWAGALHSYLQTNTPQAAVHGLENLSGFDKISGKPISAFPEQLRLDQAHDHIAFRPTGDTRLSQAVELIDPTQSMSISCSGHGSVVIWNISEEAAQGMGDVTDDAWRHFACVESAWAGGQTQELVPGQSQRLCTKIHVAD